MKESSRYHAEPLLRPKIKLSRAFLALSGTLDQWGFKQYRDKRGLVISRRPDMSKVKASPAQKANQQRMRDAAKFHRQVLADPALLKKYRRIAARDQISLSAATMRDVLRKK